jgi:hypothetical protein
MERQAVDEERHRRARALGVISVDELGADPDLRFQRFDAKDNELLVRQPSIEALLIELMLVRGEAQQAITLVSDPLPWTFGPELGEIPLEGLQGSLP